MTRARSDTSATLLEDSETRDTGTHQERGEGDPLPCCVHRFNEAQPDLARTGRQRDTDERVVGADGRDLRAIDVRTPAGIPVLRHDERRAFRRGSAEPYYDLFGIGTLD